MNVCTSNEWIPKICMELDERQVKYCDDDGLHKLKEMLILNEHHGKLPNGDAAKWFYPIALPCDEWRVPGMVEGGDSDNEL